MEKKITIEKVANGYIVIKEESSLVSFGRAPETSITTFVFETLDKILPYLLFSFEDEEENNA